MLHWSVNLRRLRGITIAVGLALVMTVALLPMAAQASSYSSRCSAIHYVHKGENLSRIARHYGANYWGLARANGISNPSLIYAGQRLCIPNIYANGGYKDGGYKDGGYKDGGYKDGYMYGGYKDGGYKDGGYGHGYYRVHKGDTLSGIARYFSVTISALSRANGIRNPSRIYPGQVLRIPRW
jgi:lysozyme